MNKHRLYIQETSRRTSERKSKNSILLFIDESRNFSRIHRRIGSEIFFLRSNMKNQIEY